jgi:hypothetical protein
VAAGLSVRAAWPMSAIGLGSGPLTDVMVERGVDVAPGITATAFDFVADIGRHAERAMNAMTAEALDASPVHVGSRFRAAGHQRGRDWPSDLVVTECDRPTRFAFLNVVSIRSR